jgi:hypothetical protein
MLIVGIFYICAPKDALLGQLHLVVLGFADRADVDLGNGWHAAFARPILVIMLFVAFAALVLDHDSFAHGLAPG